MAHASALVVGTRGTRRVPRYAAWDALFILLAAAHAGVLLMAPPWFVIALGLWWNANTISHNFIHRPFFRAPAANRAFSFALSLVLGFPQTLWRDRHLRHHAGLDERVRVTPHMAAETIGVLTMFAAVAAATPQFFATAYLPGWFMGLGLCWLHGKYEHVHGTTSHYSRLYNLLFFNDGYHVEHHTRPAAHWTELTRLEHETLRVSRWPAVLRWMEAFTLTGLERIVLHRPWLQRFVVGRHERAFRRLLPHMPHVERVTIVGGGLFPRSAIVVDRILPGADVTIVDADHDHLEAARPFLRSSIHLIHARFSGPASIATDLLVVPLAFDGNRQQLYSSPPARLVLVHDWIWRVRARGVVVSWLLLKRLNLAKQ